MMLREHAETVPVIGCSGHVVGSRSATASMVPL
jgi:hypothetical protein